MQKLPWYRYWL